MRAKVDHEILFLNSDDLPVYKKGGSVVRNTYFWALKAIAAQAPYSKDWEYEAEVWLALQRVLLSFSESGYLSLKETILEFPAQQAEIPAILRPVATWE
jgi:hypothetical protein